MYSDGDAPVTCKFCSVGTYGDVEALATCKDCPFNTYTDSAGQSACKDCFSIAGLYEAEQCWLGVVLLVCLLLLCAAGCFYKSLKACLCPAKPSVEQSSPREEDVEESPLLKLRI
tara:strand:+ start:102 stop:446 length:345 start_codon:yes stop_codon:yes gene_type:complete